MPSKHILKSKTLWLNVIASMLLVLETNLHFLQGALGNEWYVAVITLLAGANAFMRLITKSPVHLKKGVNDAH